MIHLDKNQPEQKRFEQILNGMQFEGKPLYIGHLLARAAELFTERPALIFQDQSISYQDLYLRACQLQSLLESHHINKNSHVIVSFENSIEFYIAYFAAWQTGAVVIPLSTFLTSTEINHIIKDAHPSVIITETARVSLFKEAQTPEDTIIITEVEMHETYTKTVSAKNRSSLPTRPPEELCLLLYTSGTTGTPKGVMLSSKNITTNIAQVIARFGLTTHERIFGILPLFHVFAQNTCIWSALFIGATIILVHKIERRLLLDALKHKPTIFLGVPALYGLLCLLKQAPLDSVNCFASGGDALPDKIKTAFALIYGRKIINGYGLTETSPVIAADFDDALTFTNTVGKPVVGITCSIRDKYNKELPIGEIGQLWVQGENIMLGYYNSPESTEKVIVDGWFDTGDCAYKDKEGKLIITGREKDLIINKGLNIYPQEIENVLLSCAHVIRAAVIGKEDPQEGEIPIAFIQLQKKVKNIEKLLKEHCKQNLAQYKVPRLFICDTTDLPLTSTGKIDKKILKERMKSD